MPFFGGTAAGEFIQAEAGDDTIDGFGGNDTLYGNDGNDIYFFNGAFGADQVWDRSGVDQIRIGSVFGPGDFRLYRVSGDLVLDQVGGGQSIRLNDRGALGPAGIETVVFERDGTVYDLSGPVFRTVGYTGTAGADFLQGTAFDERIRGLGGNDTLYGDDGNDIYVFGGAFGADQVWDRSGVDQVRIGRDYSEVDFRIEIRSGDLNLIQVNGTQSLRFNDRGALGPAGIETVVFERTGSEVRIDGTNWVFVPGYFDYQGYLSANPDVRAAGLDAYQHYSASGWREGRDPSARFDTSLYLLQNRDVAAAGINPLEHFLSNGQAEGRSARPAVGPTGDGFDTSYYLLANPDVGFAGINARAHFDSNGWREGRDPNSLFDSSDYLARNPDVAAAGLNPFSHYMSSGWRENRDPSAAFDTSAYLAANGDVAAAGLNPLLHYLAFGIYEGRSLGLIGGA